MSSLVDASMRRFAVISVRTEPGCERLIIAYPDEKTLRDLLAPPSILGLGYRSREEAQAGIDRYETTPRASRRKLTATFVADTTQSLKDFVAGHLLAKDKFNRAKTQSIICDLLQHTFAAAVARFYSKNMFSAVVRALISF